MDIGAMEVSVEGKQLVELVRINQPDLHGVSGLTFDVRGGPLAGRPLDGGVRPLAVHVRPTMPAPLSGTGRKLWRRSWRKS
jgi:hypothetical protein